jgi:hypothetical protein
MKKYQGEFSGISSAFQKREAAIAETSRINMKLKKQQAKERTPGNMVKTEQTKKNLEQVNDL